MWSEFGFYTPADPVAVAQANRKVNQPVTTDDGRLYVLNTDRPIDEDSLKIDINGLIQDPRDGDYELNPDRMSFTWKGVPLTDGSYSILTDFDIAAGPLT